MHALAAGGSRLTLSIRNATKVLTKQATSSATMRSSWVFSMLNQMMPFAPSWSNLVLLFGLINSHIEFLSEK